MGLGWIVTHVADANDIVALRRALAAFHGEKQKPTLIIVDSHIGYGSPKKQDSHSAHGEALGVDEVKATKKVYGWPEDAQFLVPDGVRERFQSGVGTRGAKLRAEWDALFAKYAKEYPTLAQELVQIQKGELPSGWDKGMPTFPADAKGMATRDAGGKAINAAAQAVPWLVGGSADLAPSTKTHLKFDGAGDLEAASYGGRNMHFGIREHGMGSICNGMALSGLRSFGATFLIFCDYMRPVLRLASLMEIGPIFVFTHDSIGVGEDGPTHQPIEQLASMRAIPGVVTIRPCDANETTEAWKAALENKHGPTCLALTRQAVPTLDRAKLGAAAGLHKGAYVLSDSASGAPDLILIGSGSEVSLCVGAAEKLAREGVNVRVVSMPSWELFARQSAAYQKSVLPPECTARPTASAKSG
jgi:transketolase